MTLENAGSYTEKQATDKLPDINTRFGNRLRSLREAAMLTPEHFGQRSGMSARQIYLYEIAEAEADLNALNALAQGLGLTLQELMFDV